MQEVDFIHTDPPYDLEFTTYTQDGFNWVERLATERIRCWWWLGQIFKLQQPCGYCNHGEFIAKTKSGQFEDHPKYLKESEKGLYG